MGMGANTLANRNIDTKKSVIACVGARKQKYRTINFEYIKKKKEL